jgi:flagellar basal-body rod protein FlgC
VSASAFDIAASGMAAHRLEMDVIAQNIANADVRRPDGSAYRPRTAVFEPASSFTFADMLDRLSADDASSVDDMDDGDASLAGVRLAGIVDGGAPIAGVVPADSLERAAADDDPIEQMVSLVAAGRAYDADVAALQAAKQMDVEAIDVDRV